MLDEPEMPREQPDSSFSEKECLLELFDLYDFCRLWRSLSWVSFIKNLKNLLKAKAQIKWKRSRVKILNSRTLNLGGQDYKYNWAPKWTVNWTVFKVNDDEKAHEPTKLDGSDHNNTAFKVDDLTKWTAKDGFPNSNSGSSKSGRSLLLEVRGISLTWFHQKFQQFVKAKAPINKRDGHMTHVTWRWSRVEDKF